MTGVELYIRDNDNYYCYKQRHDGYYIDDYIKELGAEIFSMGAEEIIHSFHDKYFAEDSEYNYHEAGKPLEFGIVIPKIEVKSTNFDTVYESIDKYISANYSDNEENDNYDCGYGDWVVYIDLLNRSIEGVEDEEDTSCEDDDGDIDDEDEYEGPYGHGGCGYNGGYGNRSNNSFNDFLNGKFGKY
jgi:hypothetical protein